MKNKLKIIVLFALTLLTINTSVANADPTYAVLDSNGKVTNVIVCGSACEGGTFGGQTVVLQIAADPVTNENRGGVWQGPNTTTYSNDGVFTVNHIGPVTRTEIELDDQNVETISSVTVNSTAQSFSYTETLSYDIDWSKVLKDSVPTINTGAKISVLKDNEFELLDFEKSKTKEEILQSAAMKNLKLISSKIKTLLNLLGSWVKP
jgi:hypothetical protein